MCENAGALLASPAGFVLDRSPAGHFKHEENMSERDEIAVETLNECQTEGASAFARLVDRRQELAAVASAACTGQLVERPLSAEERELIRDALGFAYCIAASESMRNVIFGGADGQE